MRGTPLRPFLRRARPAAWRHARWVGPVRVLACLVAVVCVTALVGAATLRATVLERGYYQAVLDDERAYDRLYDEVLVDPRSRPVTRSLLSRLPVPETVVTANLKTVLPPTTVRQLTGEQIAALTGYFRGDSRSLGVSVNLRPVLANVGELAQVYLGGLASGERASPEAKVSAVLARVDEALDRVAAGREPAGLPEVELSDRAVDTVTSALLSGVPANERASLRPQVEGALAAGDTGTALAAVGPHLPGTKAGSGEERSRRDLLRMADGGRWNAVHDLRGAGVDTGALESARAVTRLMQGPAQTLAVAVGLLALVFLWVSGPPGRRTRGLRTAGWILAVGGALPAVAFWAVRHRAGDLLWQAPASWPPSLAGLAEDLQRNALAALGTAGLSAAAVPLAAGALLVTAAAVRERHRAVRTALRALNRRTRTRLVGGTSAAVAAAVVFGVVLAPTAAGEPERAHCNGSAQLCDLRYDEAAYLTTHNSMSSTADRFISPLQDGDITTQLDDGARALLVDTHTWEPSDRIAERLKVSDFAPGMQRKVAEVIDKAGPARPGLWLCHAACRAGALPLVETLREIRVWLQQHPEEVVTLVVQNGITGEQTASAFRKAGLQDLLFTPDRDPESPWPTLGEMVAGNKRLVVFSEGSGGPAGWYRGFYRYGMETPYDFPDPGSMSCAPNRGGTGKRLFLLNHFITDAGGSRLDAGEVNAKSFVLDRARRCGAERGRPVNFVAVDFANLGDARGAVDEMNAARAR
ncbi:PI-PLC domain-containing protein [Streptomyces abyssalis]|uniref:PI-PLC domain-containing protein n=1 Tax=Streptomyces abyssalis TaxID=933944 RepID=UPI00209B69EB|nr:PI-PLC domain-containing protein [Streptomyces abyssalis]